MFSCYCTYHLLVLGLEVRRCGQRQGHRQGPAGLDLALAGGLPGVVGREEPGAPRARARGKNTPPGRKTRQKTSFQSVKSGAGEQLLPQDCRAKLVTKGVLLPDAGDTVESAQFIGRIHFAQNPGHPGSLVFARRAQLEMCICPHPMHQVSIGKLGGSTHASFRLLYDYTEQNHCRSKSYRGIVIFLPPLPKTR